MNKVTAIHIIRTYVTDHCPSPNKSCRHQDQFKEMSYRRSTAIEMANYILAKNGDAMDIAREYANAMYKGECQSKMEDQRFLFMCAANAANEIMALLESMEGVIEFNEF